MRYGEQERDRNEAQPGTLSWRSVADVIAEGCDVASVAATQVSADNRNRQAEAEFAAAAGIVAAVGLVLECEGVGRYRLERPNVWQLYCYPGEQRIYRGQSIAAPRLDLPTGWGLLDVARAAERAVRGC